jgi:hypothetical protein
MYVQILAFRFSRDSVTIMNFIQIKEPNTMAPLSIQVERLTSDAGKLLL